MGRLSLRVAECRGVANGDVERSRRAISDARLSLLLNTCDGMTNRVLIDDGARRILLGDEQERENRTVWCQSSPQYTGVDNFWPCEGARETRAE